MNDPKAELYVHDLSAASWRKSSFSGAEHNCVEIADLPGGRAARDSKHPERGPLRFTALAWAAFQRGVITGEL
ncbi:DUF397 domain-containing protein [Streptomyces flavofungini]|uniref:DUF397 domain-containing protein n=1 Tax=Streptomyces flavofungini TaxID=68200 RepID=UPI0025AF1261|nr:DUF397 domain-containing protein [Streptomyces flavofungini]WJV51735.1 DUF397 domain-containing protein [Streptomyces flavofungini]